MTDTGKAVVAAAAAKRELPRDLPRGAWLLLVLLTSAMARDAPSA